MRVDRQTRLQRRGGCAGRRGAALGVGRVRGL